MLAFSLEVTPDITKDLSEFLSARINTLPNEPEILRNYLGDDKYERYQKAKKAANRLFENLEGMLSPDDQYLIEDFEMQIIEQHGLLGDYYYVQGLLDGIKLGEVIRK